MKLYKITYDLSDKYKLDISSPENIKELYNMGLLVKDATKFYGKIEAEITKDGYRIVKKYPMWKHHICNTSIRPDKCYFTYEEAKKEVDENVAEFYRQANLSEYDWSLEQICKTIDRYINIIDGNEDVGKSYQNWFKEMENVEDIETRIYDGEIQWKYEDNKKWRNIDL